MARLRDACREQPKVVAVASADSAAHLAHAAAALTRLGAPDPDAWAEAAPALGTPRRPVVDGHGPSARGRSRRRIGRDRPGRRAPCSDAHQLAVDLGAVALLAEIEAVSRRTRLGVEPPAPRVLAAATIDHLGLTPREAEVLALRGGRPDEPGDR